MTVEPDRKPRGRPKGTGSKVVHETLRRRILALELAPGADVSETAVAEEFGVSRTPVREALLKLEAEGLVSLMANHGARVVTLDLSEVSETLEALELLQRSVNRWAAEARTESDLKEIERCNETFREAMAAADLDRMALENYAFHKAVGDACGNATVAQCYDTLLGRCLRLSRMNFARGYKEPGPADTFKSDSYEIVADQHDDLIQAIRDRDAAAADRIGADHATLFRQRIQSFVGRNRAPGITL